MKSLRTAAFLRAATAASLVAGCASDLPAPVLLTVPATSVAAITEVVPPPGAPAVLVIRRLDLPEYMTTRRVRYRSDASTIVEWPNTYWAERVEIAMLREYAAALRQAMPGWAVCEASCADRGPGLAVQVHLARLDYLRPAQKLAARVRVDLVALTADARVIDTREQSFSFDAASDSPQAEAQSLGELVAALARWTTEVVGAARAAP